MHSTVYSSAFPSHAALKNAYEGTIPEMRLRNKPARMPEGVSTTKARAIQARIAPILPSKNCVRVGPRVNIRRTVPTLYSPPTILPARMMISISPMKFITAVAIEKEVGRRSGSERDCSESCRAWLACACENCWLVQPGALFDCVQEGGTNAEAGLFTT